MTSASENPVIFEPLEDYVKPVTPTDEMMRRAIKRFKAMMAADDDAPYIASDRLGRMPGDTLDQVAARPPFGPLVSELEASVAGWLPDATSFNNTLLVVLPPCDRHDLVTRWAEAHGHEIYSDPDRATILNSLTFDLSGEGLLAIPRLEQWFLRKQNGLQTVRNLLAALAETDRKCVVGCGSWAWRYLVTAVSADLMLPKPISPKAFDAERLHDWISSLAETDERDGVTFRQSSNGKDVLARDEAGKFESDYLKRLAAQSRGIPWIAWHLWRLSLREEQDDQDGDSTSANSDRNGTLWVTSVPEFATSAGRRDHALLILHALLLHGSLTLDELRQVLPGNVGLETVVDLVSREIVGRDGKQLFCLPAAYPAMREELNAAGYAMDGI